MKPPPQKAQRNAEDLLPAVDTELRRLAARRMAGEDPGQTLQATALVHEAWLRLSADNRDAWDSPQQFYRAAANAMRCILIDNARRKKTPKHGGHLQRVDLSEVSPAGRMETGELLAVDEALDGLAEVALIPPFEDAPPPSTAPRGSHPSRPGKDKARSRTRRIIQAD